MDVGIDLGTTFSVVALDGKVELDPDYPGGPGLYLDDCDVTVIPSPLGEPTFSSVMIPDPDSPANWLFGAEALQKAEEGYAPVMFSKRKIGTTEVIPVLNGTVTAKEVAVRFLRHMKECAERALGQPVTRAVVTHPAYFDRGAVEQTRESAREAGFDMALPQQMLMEPTAAALAYTRADRRDPLRILTYDLGGGTFDVTYMERIDGVIQIRAFDGNHLLGGYNFDKELVRLVRTRLAEKGRNVLLDENDPEDRGRLARLLRIAENVKIELSKAKNDADEVEFRVRNILVDSMGVPVQVNERISRRQFVAVIQTWLDQIIECCVRAVEKSKAKPEDLHQILMVGGSSYGPWVRDSLKAAFPNAEIKLFNPDLCVGAGAAIHARMTLPHGKDLGDYCIEREVPEISVLDRVHLAGRFVQSSTGLPPNAPFDVLLQTGSGSRLQPIRLDNDGRFLIKDVELTSEGANLFTLCLVNEKGHVVAEDEFTVNHVPPVAQGAQNGRVAASVTGSTTVLPRPLYIDTARGMVSLAEEGVALPAKCVACFERTHSEPIVTLRLYQEREPVGSVRIENIPQDAGRGSPVELTLEVTADNQVRGDVVIYRLVPGKSGTPPARVEALRSPIHIAFDPTAIPETDELREQFDELLSRAHLMPVFDPELAQEVLQESNALIERVRRSFEHQPFERQEVYVDIRRLRSLLFPPEDNMSPTKREFITQVGKCRRDMQGLINTNKAIIDELMRSGKDQMEIDGRKVSIRRATAVLKKLDDLDAKLEGLQGSGLEAHAKKDRLSWPKHAERLCGVEDEIRKLKPAGDAPDITKLPTPLLKIIVMVQEIRKREDQVRRYAQALQARRQFDDWLGELEGIMDQLRKAHSQVVAIDDDTPTRQALAQIQKILEHVRSLDSRISAIGKDLT